MRTRIRVTDLTPLQWAAVRYDTLRKYYFTPGTARVCVELETAEEVAHVEMPVRAFMFLLNRLQWIGAQAQVAEAALTPDALPDDLEVKRNAVYQCFGDDQEAINCPAIWPSGPGTLAAIKTHIQTHPTHQVGVVQENRAVYEAQR